MGDFFDKPTRPKARKPHRCIACYGVIATGEQHIVQTGFFDGHAFRNRMHDECWDVLSDSGNLEFMPGELDMPDRLRNHHKEAA